MSNGADDGHANPLDQRVLVLDSNVEGSQELQVITLPNPKTSQPSLYGLVGKYLYEIQSSEPVELKGSWFLDNTVEKNGKLLVGSKVDPLFIILPLMSTQESTFRMVDDLLDVKGEENVQYLSQLVEPVLNVICTTKAIGSDSAFKFSEEKAMAWIQTKLWHIINALRPTFVPLGHSSDVSVRKSEDPSYQKALLVAAVGFISEYLSQNWVEKLCNTVGVASEEIEFGKKKSGRVDQYFTTTLDDGVPGAVLGDDKKRKRDSLSTKVAPKKVSKLGAVAAKGMKTMTAFFKKK